MSKILNNLYLGDCDTKISKGIKCDVIIDLDFPNNGASWHKITIDTSQEPTIIKVGLHDSTDEHITKILIILAKLIKEYLKDNKKIHIGCHAGISRSASAVIAYLMIYKKWGYQKSYEYTKSKRSIVNPNPSFKKQLRELEKAIKS